MQKLLNYCSESDTLSIRKGDEKTEFSITDDNHFMGIDINKKGQIVGLEFLNVSKIVPKKILKNIDAGKVKINYEKDARMIKIEIALSYKKDKKELVLVTGVDYNKNIHDELIKVKASCA